MDFSTELVDFPSAIHRNVYAFARGITPLERSLISVAEPSMRLSCEAYHGFVIGMLSDMYDHPDEYGLPVMALEHFCGDKKVNALKQRFPSKAKTILAQTRNAVHGYVTLLYLLGKHGSLHGNTLTVSSDDLKAIGKHTSTATSPIRLGKRLEALARTGFLAGENGFVSTRYPDMFPAICALAATADKLSGFDFFAFCRVDFRNLHGKYKPTYEDYFLPLIATQREQAHLLHDYAVRNKLSPTINTFWKVDYKYKGMQVMCIGTDGDHERILDVRITCTYHCDDPTLINGRLAKETPEFQKQALRRVWRCDACATTHLGRTVTVLGKKQRVCGGGVIGFRWRNPTTGDLDDIRRFIQLRCDIIDEILITKNKHKGFLVDT